MRIIGIGNAPVSFGVWEERRARDAAPDEPDRFLSAVARAGYAGTELGPPGYLGTSAQLPTRLEAHGLHLVGGYLPIRFADRAALEEDLASLGDALDLLAAARTSGTLVVCRRRTAPKAAPFGRIAQRCRG